MEKHIKKIRKHSLSATKKEVRRNLDVNMYYDFNITNNIGNFRSCHLGTFSGKSVSHWYLVQLLLCNKFTLSPLSLLLNKQLLSDCQSIYPHTPTKQFVCKHPVNAYLSVIERTEFVGQYNMRKHADIQKKKIHAGYLHPQLENFLSLQIFI